MGLCCPHMELSTKCRQVHEPSVEHHHDSGETCTSGNTVTDNEPNLFNKKTKRDQKIKKRDRKFIKQNKNQEKETLRSH